MACLSVGAKYAILPEMRMHLTVHNIKRKCPLQVLAYYSAVIDFLDKIQLLEKVSMGQEIGIKKRDRKTR